MRLIGARIADVPVNAALADVLVLLFQFSPEELQDSGLMARVVEAENKAMELIRQAANILEPLKIGPETLREVVWQNLRRSAEQSKAQYGSS